MPLTLFENLEEEAREHGIIVDEETLQADDPLDGLCVGHDGAEEALILLNRHRHSRVRNVALAEELGHYHKSVGDVIEQNSVAHRKSENAGRAWAYKRLVPPEKLREMLRAGYFSFFDIAEEFEVTVEFLVEAMAYYQRKGISISTSSGESEVPEGFQVFARNATITEEDRRSLYFLLSSTIDDVLAQLRAENDDRV